MTITPQAVRASYRKLSPNPAEQIAYACEEIALLRAHVAEWQERHADQRLYLEKQLRKVKALNAINASLIRQDHQRQGCA